MLHPFEREYIERRSEAMVYIAQQLTEADPDMATRADFGEFVRTVYIGMDRTVGLPPLEPVGPCPDFQRADEPAKEEAPAHDVRAAPSPTSTAQPQRNLAGHEHRDGKVHLASEKQVAGIFRWTARDPRYEEIMKRYLAARNLLEPGQLTMAEASDLMDEFARSAGLRPKEPQGAKA